MQKRRTMHGRNETLKGQLAIRTKKEQTAETSARSSPHSPFTRRRQI